MTEERDPEGDRNPDTNSGRSADYSADQNGATAQTPPSAVQKPVAPRGTTALLETKDDRSTIAREPLAPKSTPVAEDSDTDGQLFAANDQVTFRARWDSIQTRFVDQPTQAVKEADALVTEVVDRLTQTFGAERETLDRQTSNTDTSTEDLRQAFRKYRAFFDRLLVA